MQTELKTAKDDKLVDLDVSGEGAEVELEDKSHGTVKPDKYEEVKTEEKEPLAPQVEVADEKQSEEMDQYSDKVKKRIDKLTYKIREAEREKEAALVFAQNVQKELRAIKLELAQELEALNNAIKISNMAGIPMLFLAFGILYWAIRKYKISRSAQKD